METSATFKQLDIPVDPEHGALRLSVTLLFLGLLVGLYIIVNLLITAEGINILAVILALIGAYVITQQIESRMKKRWLSGRAVQVDETGVRITSRKQVETEINPNQQVNVLMWRFKIKKRTRVPKGWFVVALSLEQEGVYLPVYTFVSPDDFEKMNMANHFAVLTNPNELKGQSGDRDLRLAGQQRRLHTAEQARWMHGAEMSTADFDTYVQRLQTLYPKWMPSK